MKFKNENFFGLIDLKKHKLNRKIILDFCQSV